MFEFAGQGRIHILPCMPDQKEKSVVLVHCFHKVRFLAILNHALQFSQLNCLICLLLDISSITSSLHSSSASDHILIVDCLSSFPALQSVCPSVRKLLLASSSVSILLMSSPSHRPHSSLTVSYLSFLLLFLLF